MISVKPIPFGWADDGGLSIVGPEGLLFRSFGEPKIHFETPLITY